MTIQRVPEAAKARQWREDVMHLSRAELSKLIGMSVSAISDYESGLHRGKGSPITAEEWTRYRLTCAAIAARLDFDWKRCLVTVIEMRKVNVMRGSGLS